MWFTTSWDDGHPLDSKLAELLDRHGFKGTFYVPQSNREGLPVLDRAALRILDGPMEIGSHTLDHAYANRVSKAEWVSQVVQGKHELEQMLGHPVAGFCYPGGKFDAGSIAAVRAADFAYARTIQNLRLKVGSDQYQIPTTLQFFPHERSVIFRNWLRQGDWVERASTLVLACGQESFRQRLSTLLDAVCRNDGVFHLWGHSWELEQFGLWAALEEFLIEAKERVPRSARLTNGLLAKQFFGA